MSTRDARMVALSALIAIALVGPGIVPVEASFSPGWSVPFQLAGFAATPAVEARVAMDSGGNATVVWVEEKPTGNEIHASRMIAGQGWEGPELLTNATAPNAFDAWTAMGDHGEAFATWVEWDGNLFNIVAKRYDPAYGWGANVILLTTVGWPHYRPRIAVDPEGNGHFVWEGWNGTRNRIYWARYSPQSGYRSALAIDDAGEGYYPEVAVGKTGNVIVVWYSAWGDADVRATRYRPGFDWDPSRVLDRSGAWDAFNPVIAMDVIGNGYVAWQQYDGTHWGIWATQFLEGLGWQNATRLDRGVRDAQDPSVAAGPEGTAIVGWTEQTGTRAVVVASRYSPGPGWNPPEDVSASIPDSGSGARVAMDAEGNALAVWTQANASGSGIFASLAREIGSWESPVPLSASGKLSRHPRLAMDPKGDALAVWEEGETPSIEVWAAQYGPLEAAPPSSRGMDWTWLLLLLPIAVVAGALIVVAWVRKRPLG